MATSIAESDDGRWERRGRTTIELRRNERGRWFATQRGVSVEGRGRSAAAAAAAYCRAIDGEEE